MAGVSETHLALIREQRPDAASIEQLGHGDINEVVLVDHAEIFRFPKDEAGQRTLEFETSVLKQLAGKLTLQSPRPEYLAPDNAYGIFEYIPGSVLQNRQISDFSPAQRQELGKAVATLIVELNQAVDLDEISDLKRSLQAGFMDDEQYYLDIATYGQKTTAPYLEQYESYLNELKTRFDGELPSGLIMLHGDLHAGNLIFDNESRLIGVIDFGDCGPGTIYNELRQLYSLGEPLVQAVVNNLDGAFGNIDMTAMRLYAIMHEFSVLVRPTAQTANHERPAIARKLLKQWLGENWNKS